MKRAFTLLPAFLLVGCLTAPITEKNFNRNDPPMPGGSAYLSGMIPGLPQLLNGEYLEAAIYAAGTYIPAAFIEGNIRNKDALMIISGTMMPFYIAGYIDGIYSTEQREWQYCKIAGISYPMSGAQWKGVELKIGMSQDELIALKGRPKDVNKTVTEGNVREQWIYESWGKMMYFYFDNGYLTAWQE